ncbi:MAG: diguanylate cyclase [Proteobacteria bacterium SG_bin9]|nr:MAG: diguanylate cyclase [Proteobacteria bacterium SG_bin9]
MGAIATKQKTAATLLNDLAVLQRKWQAATRPDRSLPSYEEIMLGSLGRLSDHIALLKADDACLHVIRAGRYVQQWLGAEAYDVPVAGLVPDCALSFTETAASALKNRKPYLGAAHCARDGMMRVYDILAMPMRSRGGGTYVAIYVNERGTRFNLLDTIVGASAEGILSLAAVRDERGQPFDFQVVYLNRGASDLLAISPEDLQWSRIGSSGHQLGDPSVLARLIDVVTMGVSQAFEVMCGDRCLRLSAAVFGDLISLTLTDVTELKRRERSSQLLFSGNPMPMWLFDIATTEFIAVNDAAVEHYGYDRASFLSKKLRDIWPRDEWEVHSEALGNLGDAYHSSNWRHLKADGTEIEVLTFGRRMNFEGRDAFLVAAVDITERRKAEARVAYLAHHDALTGLPNRVLYLDRLKAALERAPADGREVAVLCADLDLFKNVNDSFGHPVGDRLLKLVAARLRDVAGVNNLVARLGGDEFAIVLEADAAAAAAGALATRLIRALSEPYDIDGIEIVIGASVGIAIAPGDGATSDELLRNADMALYRAKEEGRGAHCFFEKDMDRQAQKRRILETDLRRALAQGEFQIHYQPLVDVAAYRIAGFEALLRWKHPEKGMISPAEFIPVAEDIGLIGPIGEWVLRQACEEATRWPAETKIAVNLSPVQFRNRNLVQTVMTALAHSGLAAHRLELEITESLFLADSEANLATLHALRALGVRISMDDFGTGYSSLSYLRSFPFDKIKIDRSFVRDLASRPDCAAIVRAISGLGRSLNITTTAEGVETSDQLDRLRAEGCDQVQGFLFSPALPAQELAALFAKFERDVRAA